VTTHPPPGPAPSSQGPSPDDGSGPDNSPGGATLAMRARVPWRWVGADAASLGTPVGIAMLHPMLGEVIAVIGIVVGLTIIATALFGSHTLSERAFRLLHWFGNRPEPPGPSGQQEGMVGGSPGPPQ
jgi:hypothetical protein